VDLAAVYSREIDGITLTLIPSGWTYERTFVLYDRQTNSLWYPYEKGLMGIQGVYFKRWLPMTPWPLPSNFIHYTFYNFPHYDFPIPILCPPANFRIPHSNFRILETFYPIPFSCNQYQASSFEHVG